MLIASNEDRLGREVEVYVARILAVPSFPLLSMVSNFAKLLLLVAFIRPYGSSIREMSESLAKIALVARNA